MPLDEHRFPPASLSASAPVRRVRPPLAVARCRGARCSSTVGSRRSDCARRLRGFDATSRLKLCEGKLCSVILVVPVAEGGAPGWMKQYRSIQSALVKKYGIASTSESVTPEECSRDSSPCFEDGRASVRTTWSWQTGQSISLLLGRIDAAVSIGIVYSASKQAKKGQPNPSAL